MEFPAASAHRGLVSWLGVLLAVFLLAFWIPGTTAHFAIVTTRAVEGQDVILHTQNMPSGVIGYIWYRGIEIKHSNLIGYRACDVNQHIRGPEYSGREIANIDGSLTIRNVTARDLGIYGVVAVLPHNQNTIGYGWLSVYPPVSMPRLLASNTTVTENEDAVVMSCYTKADFTFWLYNSKRLQLGERMKLSRDHRTLLIDPVRREDAGNYQCKVSNLITSIESAPVQLDVKY